LLEAFVEVHDPAQSERDATEAMCAKDAPGDRAAQAQRIADKRLGGLRSGALPLPDALRTRIDLAATAQHLARAGLLVAAWDVLSAIAVLHGNQSDREERKLELLAVMAMGLEDLKLAQRLHDAHLRRRQQGAAREARHSIEAPAAELERRLQARDRQREPLAGHPVGLVLSHLEVRALAAIGSLYFERAAIEEDGVGRLHELSRAQKVSLIQVLTAVAWADGRVSPEERRLVEHHVALADLPAKTTKRLLEGIRGVEPKVPEALELEPLEPTARRFVLEQGILLSLVDDDLDEAEQALLERVAERLGATPLELEQVMVEVSAFYEKNREAVHDFGPVSGAFGRLRALVVERAHRAVTTNTRRIMQEIKETGELAKLLGAASVRPLTPEEAAKVRAQLLDICKTIPALALFALPGGALLLPVLLKVLPFNLLPTAFADEGGGQDPRQKAV
jgi:uncharacterized tellurite resistance protein B-like protein